MYVCMYHIVPLKLPIFYYNEFHVSSIHVMRFTLSKRVIEKIYTVTY